MYIFQFVCNGTGAMWEDIRKSYGVFLFKLNFFNKNDSQWVNEALYSQNR